MDSAGSSLGSPQQVSDKHATACGRVTNCERMQMLCRDLWAIPVTDRTIVHGFLSIRPVSSSFQSQTAWLAMHAFRLADLSTCCCPQEQAVTHIRPKKACVDIPVIPPAFVANKATRVAFIQPCSLQISEVILKIQLFGDFVNSVLMN